MFYQHSISHIIKEFNTNATVGLTQIEVEKRLKKNGPNQLPEKSAPPLILKFIDQFNNILVIILLIAASISLFLGDRIDTLAIAAIVFINAFIGFIQEVQAEKTLASLREKDIHQAVVLRNGKIVQIPAAEIVTGDILILDEGTKIAADARLIESFSLRVDESILTGESHPVSKHPQPVLNKVSLADQKNMIFKETQIVSGRGKAVVTATASFTEIGKIALVLQETVEQKTPLTLELEKVGRNLTLIIGIIAIGVFLLNSYHEIPIVESLLIAISLAVAAIPEGLPAIVTIVLSLGVKRLAQKKTIVKKLPSVETLGAIKVIATDKTGTITQNKINVVEIVAADGQKFKIKGIGYESNGVYTDEKNKIINPLTVPSLEQLLRAGVLASNATISSDGIIGDTTEGSLVVAAARAHLNPDKLRVSSKRVFEMPFTSDRKMMSVIVKIVDGRTHLLYSKGAPEVILNKCIISNKKKKHILNITNQYAKKGLRSLAVAQCKLSPSQVTNAIENETLEESNFTLLGIVAMQDPLRPEIKEALAKAADAGIKTIMITGDHKQTAIAIAKEAGIFKLGNAVLTEDEVQKYSSAQLSEKIKKGATVFARISPLGKLKIIDAIKSIPHTQVAVTGDGVNDAPALKSAHIGIAMGKTGTDITREVADMVITDDNYATIVDAIREGRIIFSNLVKFTRYLISCNLSEVIVVAGGVLMGIPTPLIPIQILWINLITDGFPALALGMDPPEYDVMKRPPRDLSQGILHPRRWLYMTVEGSIMGITTLVLFGYALININYAHAQTMAFATLAFSQLTHAFNNRSTRKSLFQIGIFGNKYLILASVISIFLQIGITQSDFGNSIFKTIKLDLSDWFIVAVASLVPFIAVEIKKQLRFRILP